jgi:membrane fusion protein (multidrug efflux system)
MLKPNKTTEWLLLLVVGFLFSVSCQSESQKSSDKLTSIPVETLDVQKIPFEDTFETTAVARGSEHVIVSAESAGRIESIPVEEGDKIRRGQMLLKTDSAIDQTQLDLAENRKELARKEYERTKNLVDDGVATKQQLDRAQSSLEQARLNFQQLQQRLNDATLTSPKAGYIIDKRVDQGEYVGPGTPVLEIATLAPIEFTAHLSETRLDAVKTGDSVRIELPSHQTHRTGEVTDIAMAADGTTRTYELEITVANPDRKIRPGTHGVAHFSKSAEKESTTIPREAVLLGVTRKEVMVARETDEGSRAERREVTTGPGKGPRITIEEGLEPGDRLIVRGHRGIPDGTPIDVVSTYESLDEFLDQVAE